MKKIIRNLITAVVATTLCLTGCGSAGTADKSTDSDKSTQTASGSAIQGKLSGKHHAKITVKDYGTIEVELDADQAPITVTNFAISPHHLRLYDSGRRPGRHRNGRIG